MVQKVDERINGQFKTWNERMARRFDPESYHLHSGFLTRFIENKRVSSVLCMLAAKESESILEVGCGAGNVLEKVPRGRLVGLDISDYMLGKAKRRLESRQAELIKADAESLPFKSGIFDKVVCTEVLEHVLHPDRVMREIARVVHPQASVVVTIPNEEMINRCKDITLKVGFKRPRKIGGYDMPQRMDEHWHIHRFNLRSLKELLMPDWRIVKIDAIPFPFLPLRYAVRCMLRREKDES